MLSPIGSQLRQNFMAVHGPHLFARRDINIFEISLIIRSYKSEIFTFFIQSHNPRHSMGDNPYDFAFLSLPAPGFYNDIFNLIALKRAVYIFF